jgi:hypothetical protein
MQRQVQMPPSLNPLWFQPSSGGRRMLTHAPPLSIYIDADSAHRHAPIILHLPHRRLQDIV